MMTPRKQLLKIALYIVNTLIAVAGMGMLIVGDNRGTWMVIWAAIGMYFVSKAVELANRTRG